MRKIYMALLLALFGFGLLSATSSQPYVSPGCGVSIYVGNYTLGTPAWMIDPGGLYVPPMPVWKAVPFTWKGQPTYCWEAPGSHVIPARAQ